MTMEKCLDENELAGYADWLCYGDEKPDSRILIHVEECTDCCRTIMEMGDLLLDVEE